jgi:hypothetical protein
VGPDAVPRPSCLPGQWPVAIRYRTCRNQHCALEFVQLDMSRTYETPTSPPKRQTMCAFRHFRLTPSLRQRDCLIVTIAITTSKTATSPARRPVQILPSRRLKTVRAAARTAVSEYMTTPIRVLLFTSVPWPGNTAPETQERVRCEKCLVWGESGTDLVLLDDHRWAEPIPRKGP